MKTRLADAFRQAKAEGRGAYVAYMTIGYPTLERSEAAVETLISEGADVIELGAPFSDPFADGAVIRSAAYEALRQGVTLEDVLALAARVRARHPDVALVYTTHHETGTGVLNPIREIGAMAHEHGAVFVVDTTSSLGMIPFDMEQDNVDFCMASAQKGLMAMTGLSFIIGNEAEIRRSKDYPKRSYYCNLYLQYDFFERTGEMHFTPPVQTIYATMQALKEYFEVGEEAKFARHRRVIDAIHEGLAQMGLREVIRRDIQSGLVASVQYPDDENWDFERVHDYCYERGFTIYPGKISTTNTFRLCALGTIDAPDIEAFFRVLREAFVANNIQIPAKYNG